MRVSVILFSHKLILKVRSSWGGPRPKPRPSPTSALANRTCKSNLHGTSSYDSRPRLRRSGRPDLPTVFPFLSFASRISAALTFRVSLLGPAAGIAESSPSHTYARTRTLTVTAEFRDCTFGIVPPPPLEEHRRRDCDAAVKRSRQHVYPANYMTDAPGQFVDGKLASLSWGQSKLWLARRRKFAALLRLEVSPNQESVVSQLFLICDLSQLK